MLEISHSHVVVRGGFRKAGSGRPPNPTSGGQLRPPPRREREEGKEKTKKEKEGRGRKGMKR